MLRDGEIWWDAEMVAARSSPSNLEPGVSAPVTLRFSAWIPRCCIHTPGTGYPERDWQESTQRIFGRSTVKQDYCQRQAKIQEAQRPPITSCSCSSKGLLHPAGTYRRFTNSGPISHLEFDLMGLELEVISMSIYNTYRHLYLCVWRWKGGRKDGLQAEMVTSRLGKTQEMELHNLLPNPLSVGSCTNLYTFT